MENYNDGRTWTDVTCSTCGADCKVPFVPDGNRAVYCRDCLMKRRARDRFGVRSN